MLSREIPRDQWIRFFDDFSRQHQGWLVTVEVVGLKIGDQEEASRLPLVGVSADTKAGENRVAVMVGGRPDGNLTHIVERPKRVWLKEPEQPALPAHAAIDIESEDGTMTIVHFNHVDPDQPDLQLPGRA
ncbi:MAG TPA: DUF5335 family protein [Candidatus Binatus sp.]|nr:DUF5335 family protein [Candidatus Binatus sp.]